MITNSYPLSVDFSELPTYPSIMQALVKRTGNLKYLIICLVLLVIADGILTQYLTTHSMGIEANPFLNTVVGERKFILIKTGGALLVALLLWDMYRLKPKVALISSIVAVIAYTAIVYWNISIFFITQM